jgi:cyanate permease
VVVALGISTQGGNAVFQTAIAEEAPDRAGWASGIGMSLGFTGAILAPPVFGATVDETGSFAVALVAVSVVLVSGVGLTHRLDRAGPRSSRPAR